MINLISALNLTTKIYVCVAVFAVLIVVELLSFGLLGKWKKKTKKQLIEKAKEEKLNAESAKTDEKTEETPVVETAGEASQNVDQDSVAVEEAVDTIETEEAAEEAEIVSDDKQENADKSTAVFAFAPLMTLALDIPIATLRYVLYGVVGLAVVLGLAVFATALIFASQIKKFKYEDASEKIEAKEDEQPKEDKPIEEPIAEQQPVEEQVEEPVEDEQSVEEEVEEPVEETAVEEQLEEEPEEQIAEEETTAEEVEEPIEEEESIEEEEAVVEEEPAEEFEEELAAEEQPVEEKPVREETVFVVEKPLPMFVKPKATEKKESQVREREVVIDNVTYMMRDGRYLFNPEDDGWYIVLTKTFTAKLIQSEDFVKDYYTELKNELLSYKKVHARMSKKRESFNYGRVCLARLSIRGKTLRLHLALDPKDYEDTKYIIEDTSETKSLADTPLMYRMKNDRRLRYAKDLIAAVMAQVGAVKQDVEPVDYTAMYPYEEDEPLIERDLITRKWYKGRVPDTGFDFAQKTFKAKLIQSSDDVKEYYSQVKNHLLSYKKIHERMSKKRETFRFGRDCVARMAIRGKTLRLYLALDPNDYVDTKYKVEDFSEVKSVADTPLAIKLKNPRRLKYAIELIDDAMVNMGVIQKQDRYITSTDYASDLEYETTEALMEKGLITNVHVKSNSFVAKHFTFKAKDEEEVASDEDNE